MRSFAAMLLTLSLSARGQAAQQTPSAQTPTVAVSADVVRVDAVVADKDGHYVTDLRPEDFELSEDGKLQEITNFEYVVTGEATQDRPATQAPPVSAGGSTLVRLSARRTMAIVVDDLSLSFEGLVRARKMLADLVDERLGPGDVAAIIRTGGGIGNLQQFTSDKLLLKAAARGIPYNLARLGALNAAGPRGDAAARGEGTSGPGSNPADAALAGAEASLRNLTSGMERDFFVYRALGTLGALEGVVSALGRMPGRKSLLFVSEGFLRTDRLGDSRGVEARVDRLTDAANKAAVVFYAVDPSGLQTLMPTAASGSSLDAAGSRLPSTEGQRELRAALVTMTQDTGGIAVFDTNDLGAAVDRVFADQRGYYLLGYPTASPASDGKAEDRLHRLSIEVKRPGLRVRSRRAFSAAVDDGDGIPKATSFADALFSPFGAVEIPVRLTPLFNREEKRGSFLRCLLYVQARHLTFREEADGTRKAQVEAGVLGIGASGRFGELVGGRYTLTLTPDTAGAALERGLVATLDLPVTPGPYQIRAAVRDVATGSAGSAAQFVDVPDLRKHRLALSGIFMGGAEEMDDPEMTPSVRRFRGGSAVTYAFGVYNARVAPTDGKPRLSAYLSLYRDGHRLETVPIRAEAALPSHDGVVAVGGSLRLSAGMVPGAYTLEVIVQDTLRKARDRSAVQWIDFEIADATGRERATE